MDSPVPVVFVAMCALSCIGRSVGSVWDMWWFNCPNAGSDNALCADSKYITFYLFTRSNPTTAQTLDLGSNNLANTNFVASKPTKIIIHGVNSYSTYYPFVDMRREFLIKGDYNIIFVDWKELAKGHAVVCFPPADFNAKEVGVCTGKLITALRAAGANDIHVIGHSLGAHVAGVAGNRVSPVVNRITGLDPADWFFSSDGEDRLRPELADFVDVIHTFLYDLGTVGHVDYYLNGGFIQPGCSDTAPESEDNVFSCSHKRSMEYFTESINTATGFYGWSCPDYSAIYGGTCFHHDNRTILMGNSANTSDLDNVYPRVLHFIASQLLQYSGSRRCLHELYSSVRLGK